MSRLLCASFVLLITLPLFAQEEPILPERPLPRGNQAFLLQLKTQLTQELRQIQQMISVVNPSETQFIDALKAQQTELSKQLRDIAQQLQESPEIPLDPAGPPAGLPMPSLSRPIPDPPTPPHVLPGYNVPIQPRPYSEMPVPPALAAPQSYLPAGPIGVPGAPTLIDPSQQWGTSPWGQQKPSAELTEIVQTIESLRKEIADLKETIRALETQIQLLNRNILLSERIKEQ